MARLLEPDEREAVQRGALFHQEAASAARREYYVSTGYNTGQTVAGFFPVQGGTVGISSIHAFTEQVTGVGASMKRSIGSKVMAGKMKEIYEAGRSKATK